MSAFDYLTVKNKEDNSIIKEASVVPEWKYVTGIRSRDPNQKYGIMGLNQKDRNALIKDFTGIRENAMTGVLSTTFGGLGFRQGYGYLAPWLVRPFSKSMYDSMTNPDKSKRTWGEFIGQHFLRAGVGAATGVGSYLLGKYLAAPAYIGAANWLGRNGLEVVPGYNKNDVRRALLRIYQDTPSEKIMESGKQVKDFMDNQYGTNGIGASSAGNWLGGLVLGSGLSYGLDAMGYKYKDWGKHPIHNLLRLAADYGLTTAGVAAGGTAANLARGAYYTPIPFEYYYPYKDLGGKNKSIATLWGGYLGGLMIPGRYAMKPVHRSAVDAIDGVNSFSDLYEKSQETRNRLVDKLYRTYKATPPIGYAPTEFVPPQHADAVLFPDPDQPPAPGEMVKGKVKLKAHRKAMAGAVNNPPVV